MSKKERRVNISPATMLRPRMDKLWGDEALLHKEDAAIADDLDVLARDVSSELLVKTMLRAYGAASEGAQERLDEVVPGWLAASGHVDTLAELTSERSLGPDLRPQALAWLKAAGRSVDGLEDVPSLFLKAQYLVDQNPWGGLSQAYVGVFWHLSPQKNRAQGFAFLIDYNPPWDGSVKDAFVTPKASPRRLLEKLQEIWSHGPLGEEDIGPAEAKTVILEALNCNREAEIRLHRDLRRERDAFEEMVLSLPDGPDTPDFTMEDFDYLAQHGERPEKLMHIEQTQGRRVRSKDGEEMVIVDLRGPDFDPW